MDNRIEKEIELLNKYHLDAEMSGRWILLKNYSIPAGFGWSLGSVDVCFEVPPEYPGKPPYGFYVPAGLLCKGQGPGNYKEPSPKKPPFEGAWGIFSWTQESDWKATVDLQKGSNLYNFVLTFKKRFEEGV